MKNYSF